MAESSIYWPVDFPQQPLLDGYTEAAAGRKIRTAMDAAVAKQRNRFSNTAFPYTASFMLTMAQYITFKDFFNNDLKYGVLAFNMQTVGDPLTTKVVRFAEKNYTPDFYGLHVRITCDLEILP